MSGEGARFRQQDFLLPKYMLDAGGRSMFARALGSLPFQPGDVLLLLVNAEQAKTYDVTGFLNKELSNLGVKAQHEIILSPKTRGQLETAMLAQDYTDPHDPLAIYNIDTAFVSSTLGARFTGCLPRLDGVLGGFLPDGGHNWSFAATMEKDGEQVVTQTAEKSPLPGYALTGLYHFSRADSFFYATSEELSYPVGKTGEYYVAPLYNRLIAQGMEFVVDVVQSITPMGTPEQLKLAIMKYRDEYGK